MCPPECFDASARSASLRAQATQSAAIASARVSSPVMTPPAPRLKLPSDRGGARYRGWLADAFRAQRADGRWDLDQRHVDIGYLVDGGQLVVEEGPGAKLAVAVIDELLAQRPTQGLGGAAVDLAFDLRRVYGVADVLDRGVPDQLERAGLAVDAHPRDVDREHRRGGLHRRAAGRLDGPVPAHELGAQPDQLCDLDRSTRRPFHRDVSADDVEVFGRSLELLGGDLEELPAGLACRFKYRAADAVGDLAAARGWAKGRSGGVAGFDPHHVRRD